LLLVGLAALAYFKFDSFWKWISTRFQSNSQIEKPISPVLPRQHLAWEEREETQLHLQSGGCLAAPNSDCFAEASLAYPGLGGHLTSLFSRIQENSSPQTSPAQDFRWTVSTQSPDWVSGHSWKLLSLTYQKKVWQRHESEDGFTFCWNDSQCLLPATPKVPLKNGYGHAQKKPPFTIYWAGTEPEVRPLWAGVVKEIDTLGTDQFRVILEHGLNRVVEYEGIAKISRLGIGDAVSANQTFASAIKDTTGKYGFALRGRVADTPIDGFTLFKGCDSLEWLYEG
jgi:hypothetical protein